MQSISLLPASYIYSTSCLCIICHNGTASPAAAIGSTMVQFLLCAIFVQCMHRLPKSHGVCMNWLRLCTVCAKCTWTHLDSAWTGRVHMDTWGSVNYCSPEIQIS